jgi:hypothetical protein
MNPGACDIENTIAALEEAIKNRKEQMHSFCRSSFGRSPAMSHFLSEIFNRAGGSYSQMTQVLEHGGEFAQEFIKTAQQSIKERPWEILRRVAVYSFGIGLFLSWRRRKPSVGGKE